MSGWIKLHKSIMKWEWYTDSQTVHLFIHLVMEANYDKGRFKGIDIDRGQLFTGRKKLSEQTGISEQSIRTCLKRLENTEEITIKPTSKFSIITICNYEKYQKKDEAINQQSNQQSTSDQPATNQQLTTVKEDKTLKEEKEEDTNRPQQAARPSPCPYNDIVDLWNSTLPELPQVKIVSDQRKKSMKARWRQDKKHQSLDWWEGFFKYIRGCSFLMGVSDNGRPFELTFDWMLKPTNFVKIFEGNYADRPQ